MFYVLNGQEGNKLQQSTINQKQDLLNPTLIKISVKSSDFSK